MKKRAFERIPSDTQINFSFMDTIYEGVVTNVSNNGMYITTEKCLPRKSSFEILLPYKEEVLKLPAQVKRVIERHGFCDAMGVKLLNPPIPYLEFVGISRLDSSKHLKTEKQAMNQYYVCNICRHIVFDKPPFHCPICSTSIENFENIPDAIKRPESSEKMSEFEKTHTPVITVSKESALYTDGSCDVLIKVGKIEHEMKIEDFITYIDFYITAAHFNKRYIGRVNLRCDKFKPSVILHLLDVHSTELTVISNCNAHGNWIAQTEL
jgi:desulfoferrodoxin (superoxide reductase-like protein)